MPESATNLQIELVEHRRNRSDRVIRAGAVILVLGIVFSLIALLPLVSDIELPSTWWFLSMVTGIGLATVLVGLTMSARSRRSRRM
jgi:VIT1/CCC1 family predicted Fe2+/Mn2+ transporter